MRVLCRFAASAAVAIFLSVYLLPEWLCLPLAALSVMLGLLTRLIPQKRRRITAALLASGLAFGLVWTYGWHLVFRAPALTQANRTAVYETTVAGYPASTPYGVKVAMDLSMEGSANPQVMVYLDEDEFTALRPGDQVRLQLRCESIHRQLRDRTDYNQSRGIFLTAQGKELVLVHRPVDPPLRFLPLIFAHALKGAIAASFPSDVSGFSAALVTGDKSLLPPGLYAAFQRSGLAHIVAVSGLHVSFLIAALVMLLGRGRRSTALAGIALAGFFALSVGATPSVLRAVFMTGMLLLASLTGREPDAPTTLSLGLMLLLLGCPWAAASVGLQLSFSAVAGICLITPNLTERGKKYLPKNKVLRRILFAIWTSLATTLGALLFTTPLAVLYFGTFSPAGFVTNLLALWAVSLTFLGALTGGLLALISPALGGLMGSVAALPARYVIAVAEGTASLPFASLQLSSPYLLVWLVLSYAVVGLMLWRHGRGFRPLFPVAACALCLCAALVLDTLPVRTSQLTLTLPKTKGGNSALIVSGDNAAAVNCGSTGGPDPGNYAADRLLALGQHELDAIILTSCCREDAAGIPTLLARIDTKVLYLPLHHENCEQCQTLRETAEALGCRVFHADVDMDLMVGDARLTVLEPMGWSEGQSVLCTAGNFDALLAADLDKDQTGRLARYKVLPETELLILGDAVSDTLLQTIRPKQAVLRGTEAVPRPQLLQQLGAAGCEVWPANQLGTITFTISRK